ncbi:MAG: ATPase, T2SS/T4P/T4SS family [Phycisphaerales bacterium]
MPFLEVKTSQGLKRLDLSTGPVTIGRLPENAVVLDDDLMSRRHAIVEAYGDTFRVRDLGSRNGTKLNGQKIVAETLDNGDVIVVGSTEIRFIDPQQQQQRKRRNVPDYAEVAKEAARSIHNAATIDVDLSDPVQGRLGTATSGGYKEIIDSHALEKPFNENDIGLVDCRGVTVHQATADGLSRGGDEDVGESIRAFRLLLLAAFRARATDLHLEPRIDRAVIRLRVDGYMIQAVELSMQIFKRILGMVKILCQIDTTLKNQVQDGHFSVQVRDRRVDYRVSLTPAVHGQKMVVRVLDSSNAPSRLHELGLLPWMYDKLRAIATKDAGMLLACGPTGSGKTTTLYSCLREIDVETRNAITIEDPVEYYLEGCTQIPIDHKSGNTFSTILRSVLRQDPDVIFVGEIRDIETATVAMQAAMTGHLVYTTVHAKDSISAIFRLLDLGIETYLVANALNLIMAQRLVRLLCETCRKPIRPTPAQNMKMGKALDGTPRIYTPVGCKLCLGTGFRGRRAIFELLEFNDTLRDVVLKTPSIQAIRDVLHSGLFTSLSQYGYGLVVQGVTSIEEVERVATTE